MEDVKLLQLENDFNRTAALVYANGTSLRDCYEEFLKEIISLNTEVWRLYNVYIIYRERDRESI